MFTESPPTTADVVVIGAGLVGACCAYEMAVRGLSVTVVDRGAVASGTAAAGTGGLLVSDTAPGPELTAAAASLALWRDLPDRLTADLGHEVDLELESPGGLAVARTGVAAAGLRELAEAQRTAGISAEEVDPDKLADEEPGLTRELVTAVYYPNDARVRPVTAAVAVLAAATTRGALVVPDTEVTGLDRAGDAFSVRTGTGTVSTPAVVVAAGPAAGSIAALAGGRLPVRSRPGLLLVTEPLPPTLRHTVYDAGRGDDPTPAVSVTATGSGSLLVAPARRWAGPDPAVRVSSMRALAIGATALVPGLGVAHAIRAAGGSRPYSPDGLPVIGPDPALPGLWYAGGHGDAGVLLAPVTGRLIGELLTGADPLVDPAPYAADRPGLAEVAA